MFDSLWPVDCSMPGSSVLHSLLQCSDSCSLGQQCCLTPDPRLPPSPFAFRLSSSASVLPMNIQGWFLLELAGLISLQPKGPVKTLLQLYVCVCVYIYICIYDMYDIHISYVYDWYTYIWFVYIYLLYIHIYICIYIPFLLGLPPSPTQLGHHRAPSWARYVNIVALCTLKFSDTQLWNYVSRLPSLYDLHSIYSLRNIFSHLISFGHYNHCIQ